MHPWDFAEPRDLPGRDALTEADRAAFAHVRQRLIALWNGAVVESLGTVEDWVMRMVGVEEEYHSIRIDECCSTTGYGLQVLKLWVDRDCATCGGSGKERALVDPDRVEG